ncbi:MAG: Rid family hydrolase [Candidatus Rokuibacteriota bacterium]
MTRDAPGAPGSGRRPPARIHRASVDSGTVWEATAGYARAVRVGDRILVSGTTATGPDGKAAPGDAAAQARFILDKIERAIEALGGRLRDVVRTRVYVRRLEDWEAVAQVHGERFGAIRPANTLVQAGLVGEPYLVEIEAEAVIGAGDALQPPPQ